ncbi:hypothetical protein DU86_12835 [Methanosarcina mazei]|uniref:Helicase ATP-binding domain-containing protein n=2 Tax=Methanosarcina mazei TaxID=2209 RepID=A0A0F8UBM4_METMZ|nr:type I-D CRISPR-associated helicase Cas3' [Methanosarcina mazei]KKG03137.1 hypothetical protein DU31_12915 [Methanosarcina mazei]KKG67026.1 hypothetical protein DU67_12480 [Methanosarcina mazei]KKH35540.1 hypothetical protein DU54_13155 [Methanosarcina mazei]KKH36213.1 hypothetical protein DU50_13855 [Methanosarcina mazei]KKH52446.1 hypothetical protein DU85_15750 [Methanosarcina mazei]
MIVEELSIPRYNAEPLYNDRYPYAHQIIARDSIRNFDEFFLFLTSPTGSGKTDSWAVPSLNGNDLGVVVALYPTNALAKDQYLSINNLKKSLNSNKRIEFVTAETLGLKQEKYSYRITKGEILEDMVRKMALDGGGIIVTNPDIFVYALKGYFFNEYLKSVFKNHINTVVFDEFHLYDLKQSDIILFLLHDILITEDTALRKFVFLSATPNENISYKIKKVIGGNFIDSAQTNINSLIIDERPIMPEVELEFKHAPRFMAGEFLLKDLEWIKDFKGNERLAIILDSAHEVAVLAEALRNQTNWKICEVSGFRKDSMEDSFDILVGNKAIEVGIDFKGESAISRLIFSAHSISEFLQRFGRLRNPISGVKYRSVCFAASEVVNHFGSFENLSRAELEENIKSSMHDPKIIENFRWRYGYLEAYEYIYKNAFGIGVKEARISQNGCQFQPQKGGLPSDKNENYFRQGLELIKEHFFIHTGRTSHEILESVGFLEKTTKSEILDIIEELGSFRGSSLDIAYYDPENDQFGLYDVFFLLRWAEMDILPKKQFKRSVPDKYHKKIDDVSERVAGYVIIKNILEKPRYVKIAGRNLSQIDFGESERKPEKAYGLLPVVGKNNSEDSLDMSTIVNKIKSKGFFCRYMSNTSKISKNYYNIDDYTVLLNYKDGCLAIGLDAIYVDCVIHNLLSTK